jgi:PAS domain S-box-containing protein
MSLLSSDTLDLPFDASLLARYQALRGELARLGPASASARDELVEALALHAEELAVTEEELRQTADCLETSRGTARKEASKFRQIFELSPDPVMITDEQGRVVEVNAAAAEMLGDHPDGWSGTHLTSLLHTVDRGLVEDVLSTLPARVPRMRLRFRGRSGRSGRGSVRAIHAEDLGQLLWTVRLERGLASSLRPSSSSALDASLQARVQGLEQEVARSERALHAERRVREDAQSQAATQQNVMAIVAHEATNVARCISAWAGPLSRQALPGPQAAGLQAIAWTAQLELEIVRDLVDMTRIATPKLRSTFVPCDLAAIVRRGVDALTIRAEAARVDVGVALADALPVEGEPNRLGQLVLDVLALAIGLAGAAGHVAVLGEVVGEQVVLAVTRSGRDLRRDELDWNLERLGGDLDGAISARGAGMSLFVARQLVELHMGKLLLEPARGELGAVMRIVLPRGTRQSAPPPRSGR